MRSKQACRPVRTFVSTPAPRYVLASGNEPQPVGHELAAAAVAVVAVVDEPANAGTATAPAGTAATARMAKAVRIGR
ncbi:MAG: hypothetical protein ACRDP9_21760 [Kribbellaceae bacterium]